MTISFIIPAFNEEKYIAECLKSILLNRTPEVKEIIVVDNNSSDSTTEIARQFPGVTVLKEEKKGANNARQKGLLLASGDLVAFIDADTQLNKEWLKKVQAHFKDIPNLVGLSGPYKFYDLNSKIKEKTTALYNYVAVFVSKSIGYLIHGGNFVAKREVFLKAGGFDTNIAFYGDDNEAARRLSKYGKIKFAMNLSLPSSARRLNNEGIIISGIKYIINYFWVTIFHRPLNRAYKNIR